MGKLAGLKKRITDNSGSTLITVIVAIAFVTVLAAMLLSSTVLDVRMKSIDRRTKDDFYYAEKGLNDVYTQIGQMVSETAAAAYESVMKQYGGQSDSYQIDQQYRNLFVKMLYDNLSTILGSMDSSPMIACAPNSNGIVPVVKWSGTNSIQKCKADSSGAVTLASNGTDARNDAKTYPRTLMKNVSVMTTDSNGYVAQVTTDISIDIPALDFFGDNEDLGNYAIIAGEGLSFNGLSTNGASKVLGNVYAGVDFDGGYVGGVTLSENSLVTLAGDYIVSRGDINIKNGATLNINSDVNSNAQSNVWFESIIVGDKSDSTNATPPYKGATLQTTGSSKANFYALNDLKLDGNGSSVKIAGNYYGYNSNIEESIEYKRFSKTSSKSSAIMINGYGTTLSMNGIKNLLINGKAYIQLSNTVENPTAESLALKTNQQLYLLPTFFLKCPNPVEIAVSNPANAESEALTYFQNNIVEKDASTEMWWADDYVNYASVSANKIALSANNIRVLSSNEAGKYVAYAYIPFNGSDAYKWENDSAAGGYRYVKQASGTQIGTGGTVSAETAYFNTILSANNSSANLSSFNVNPKPATMHDQVFGSIKNGSYFDLKACVIGDGTSDSRIFASGALVEYSDLTGSVASPISNTVDYNTIAGYKDSLFHRYRNLCVKLDGKKNIAIDGVVPDVTYEAGLTASDEWWKSKYPIYNIIDIDSMPAGSTSGRTYSNDSGLFEICDNKTINSDYAGIVVAKGDITVENAKVRGLLIAGGTISVKNSTIVSDQGMIQRRIANELNDVASGDVSLVRTNPNYDNSLLVGYLKSSISANALKYTDDQLINIDRREFDYNNYMHYENWRKGQSNN